MKKHLKSVLTLTVICIVVAVLLSAVNFVTEPIIEKRKQNSANAALLEVMPNGKDFAEKNDLAGKELPTTVTKVYSAADGGFVFELTTSGYASGLVIMCGVDKEGIVTGAKCIGSNETNKAEVEYGNKFVGLNKEKANAVDTVANSTKTTAAYKGAIADAINAAAILRGESVDIRTEEEKLKDILLEVLPTADDFETEFKTVKLEGITAVYKAKNGAGFVFKAGEEYIATDPSGEVITAVDEVFKTTVSAAAKKHLAAEANEIDISGIVDFPKAVQKAYKTDGGYLFELRAAGFGINGDSYYSPSGEYIKIKISLTKEGEVIDCVTVSQAESKGYGDGCKEPKFYNQFQGKTEENYKEIDAVAGATITTNGYLSAVGGAFRAVKLLEGGI